jgi:hypothetical protein
MEPVQRLAIPADGEEYLSPVRILPTRLVAKHYRALASDGGRHAERIVHDDAASIAPVSTAVWRPRCSVNTFVARDSTRDENQLAALVSPSLCRWSTLSRV